MSSATGDQFYVTHCGTADSVLGSPGYSVRAASVSDDEPNALQLALKYPPYELPIDLWKERPARALAPRRLARTLHPDDGVWVAHSVYHEKDTMDRDRSYFSHLLHLPVADPVTVLRSWDAPDWATEYPRGSAKTLPRGRLPTGTAISDAALAAFLSDDGLAGPVDLAVAVCPMRLRANNSARRALTARFLQAFTLARSGASERDRLFVHAEPGLVTLFLYAATRLLPPAWTADLTFSTFEPHHRGIQDFQAATVIGTYLGVTGKGLDPDLASNRGYGLDTFLPRCSSRELNAALPAGFEELVALAAGEEWDLLDNVRKLIGIENDAIARVPIALALARGVERLNRGEPTIEDLLALKGDTRGAEALARASDAVWPHVRAAALADARIRNGFRDWLARPDRLDEFRREGAKALARGDLAAWDARWAVLREVADDGQRKVQIEKVLKNLGDHLAALPLTSRSRLRAACADRGVWPDNALLAATSTEELDILLAPETPAEWQGYACLAVVGSDEKNWLSPTTLPVRALMRERARSHLFAASPTVLGAYARAVRPHFASEPELLLGLFRPYTPACRPVMDRLLRSGGLEPGEWLKLIEAVNLYASDWDGFLLESDRLSRLLVALGGAGAGRDVWKGYLDELSPALLSPLLAPEGADGMTVHTWERTVHAHLKEAADELTATGAKLVAALPPGGVGKLLAANELLKWVDDPGHASKLSNPHEALLACQSFGVAPLDLVRAAYLKGGFARLELPRDAVVLEPLVALFRACCAADGDFRALSSAITQWVALSSLCPDHGRAAFQAHFVGAHVPAEWRRGIVEEPRQVPLLPEAVTLIHEGLSAPPAEEDETAFAEEPAARSRKTKTVRRRRPGTDAGIGLWVVVVVVVVAAAIGAVVLFRKLNTTKPTEPTTTDAPPAKTEKTKPKVKP